MNIVTGFCGCQGIGTPHPFIPAPQGAGKVNVLASFDVRTSKLASGKGVNQVLCRDSMLVKEFCLLSPLLGRALQSAAKPHP